MAKAQVLIFRDIPSIPRGKGISSKGLVSKQIGGTAFINGVTCISKGGEVQLHTHNTDESVTVLAGSGTFKSDSGASEVIPWDTVFVPAQTVHQFVNTGEETLSILWTYGGNHVTRTFVATGKTVVHLSDEDKLGSEPRP